MFTFLAHRIARDGYGYSSIKIWEALKDVGADVRLVDMAVEGQMGEVGARRWEVEGRALAFCNPLWWPYIEADELIGFTMFETTRLPGELVEAIDGCVELCVVPTPFCARIFQEEVDVPVRMVPLGVDTGDYPLMDRESHKGPYTFLWSGTPGYRKGWDVAYRAFWEAFGGREDVRLVLHFREMPRGVTGWRDANVRVVEGKIPHGEWLGLLQEADCFVYPARGEGFGLVPREAGTTGLPAIATDWGGLSYGIEYWALALRVARLAPAAFGRWEAGEVGEWAEPDGEHLVELMRWCAGDGREVAREVGRAAGEWLATHATWEETARGLVEVMGGY